MKYSCFIITDGITVECIFQPENYSTVHVLTKIHDVGLSTKQIPQTGLEKMEFIYSDSSKVNMLVSGHNDACYATLDHICLPWIQFYYELRENMTGLNSTDCLCIRVLHWFNESR